MIQASYYELVAKKLNLPLFADPAEVRQNEPAREAKKKPSIDAARARLGGRPIDEEAPPAGFAPGVVVTFAIASGRRMPGVIVFASRSEVHVLLDGIRLRRLPPHDVALHDGDVAVELEKIAGDARLFGLLVEGQSVRYADDSGQLVDGKVVEKCRWGALILRDDGAVVAVGFRKLWPAPTGISA
jgi:hypothetical protein